MNWEGFVFLCGDTCLWCLRKLQLEISPFSTGGFRRRGATVSPSQVERRMCRLEGTSSLAFRPACGHQDDIWRL